MPPLIDESEDFLPVSTANELPKSDAHAAMPVGLSSASSLSDTSQEKTVIITHVQIQTAIVQGGTLGQTILLLCGGPNSRDMSLFCLFSKAGFEVHSYDILNGPGCDLADDAMWDELLHRVAAGNMRLVLHVLCAPRSPNF